MDYLSAEKKVNELIYSPRINADSNLLVTLHKILIGDKPEKWYCLTCKSKMDAVYYDLKLKYYQSKKDKKMAKAKGNYRFSKEAKKNGVSEIVLIHNGKTETITEENLTDARAERILQNEAFAHNIEAVEPTAGTTSAVSEEPKAGKRGRPAKEEGQMLNVEPEKAEPAKPEEPKIIEGEDKEVK
jgi:hypothetical protein